MDIRTIIFSLDSRIVPFPAWRAALRNASNAVLRPPAEQRPVALIVPLEPALRLRKGRGPKQGPPAA